MKRLGSSLSILVVASYLVGLCGCAEEEHAIVLAIRARTHITTLEIWTKQYHEDGSVTLHQRRDFELPQDWDGYLVSVNSEPLRMFIDVPEPGPYAIHLVGVPIGVIEADPTSDRLVASLCYDVNGTVVVNDVVLGRLTRGPDSLDIDGDTFPEDLGAFCNFQNASGTPCDMSCSDAAYQAMLDCNPSPDFEVPNGCAPIGEPSDWNPFVEDRCGDCLDQDCFGGDALCIDYDEDGYPENVDCDDRDPSINPSVAEICGNDIDENCRIDIEACTQGDVPCDADRDGFAQARSDMPGCGTDCDDSDPAINPVAYEGWGSDPDNPMSYPNCDDRIDNNCNGLIDERCSNDFDDDGVERELDCNDCNAAVGPGFAESCGNGVDEDCDGTDQLCSPNDADRDGVDAVPSGTDCNDDDASIYPGAPEHCGDGIAQDCSMDRPCDDDGDNDSFGADSDDCDDTIPEINPWAVEICDPEGVDEDCDGQINEVLSNRNVGCGLSSSDDRWGEIEFETDVDHCGGCHLACDLGPSYRQGDRCQAGVCTCFNLDHGCSGDVSDYCCPDGCQDISVDAAHCGRCDDYCVQIGGEECRPTGPGGRGECHCPHEDDLRRCIEPEENACCPGVGCTNVNGDPEHCGGCENNCLADTGAGPRGDICAVDTEGAARCYCGAIGTICAGETWCTGIRDPAEGSCGCADLNTDVHNCGACGEECDLNEECAEGACFCTYADTNCTGGTSAACCPNASSCVDFATDEAHCGDCFTVCRPGEECQGGVCHCLGEDDCGESQVCCPSSGCVNALTDEANCGPTTDLSGCGHSCRPGVECLEGSCACGVGGDCGGGETCCEASYCADLNADTNDCGSCGTTCRVGEACSSGSCVCSGDCSDGDICTEDPCVGNRCEHHTRDWDDDGYCGGGCRDQDSGESGDCINGDCDDNNAHANPGDEEDCDTDFDDDCDGSTNDLNADNCTMFYLDNDDDTYGEDGTARCQCRSNGDYTATRDGDCDDDNAARNPSRSDVCNGIDDDCTEGTGDGEHECAGGEEYCCGSPAACRSCCSDSQCGGATGQCQGYICSCGGGWTDCGGSCNCNTGDDQVCCSNTCYDGECCTSGDCLSTRAPDCNNGHNCACVGGMVCETTCIHGAECCDNGDCTSGAAPDCTGSNTCDCVGGMVCAGICVHGAECCDDDDCSGARCCSNTCEECCDAGDCGYGDGWVCGGNECSCTAPLLCPDGCWSGAECCEDEDCGTNFFCLPTHECEPMG